ESHWLTLGSPADPRLCHSAPDDKLLVYPDGQGYRQEILLQDDLSLKLIDFTLRQDIVFHKQSDENFITFELQLTDSDVENAGLKHSLGGVDFGLTPGGQRIFELEVVLKKSLMGKYVQAIAERLPDQMRSTLRQILAYSPGVRRQRAPSATDAELFNRLLKRQTIIHPGLMLTPSLFGKAVDLSYAIRPMVTQEIRQIASEILSCPYRGSVRRRYLKGKALELISEYLKTVSQSSYPADELNRVYQAAAILRENLAHPPGVEDLARRVYTNRSKLYEGFRSIYGTTPAGYLRLYRIIVALQQFYTSDRSVSQVAAAVGYSNRSRFASAFHQSVGMNPKTFQLQLQRQAAS
ncbi:MAG: AraC family transcriptional regulator, partial [Cyanobacteria bacterium P01_F01_bin.153]